MKMYVARNPYRNYWSHYCYYYLTFINDECYLGMIDPFNLSGRFAVLNFFFGIQQFGWEIIRGIKRIFVGLFANITPLEKYNRYNHRWFSSHLYKVWSHEIFCWYFLNENLYYIVLWICDTPKAIQETTFPNFYLIQRITFVRTYIA